MDSDREQLLERARAAAREMLRAIGVYEGASMVAHFVDSYAQRFDRPRVKVHPVQYRELLATIGRESLLAMTARMNRELPRRLTGRKSGLLPGTPSEAAELFQQEFLNFLGEAFDWGPAERDEFRRDLAVYAQIAARELRPAKARKASELVRGAFVDRCALLLDPSMLSEARRAAAAYLVDLESRTDHILHRVFPRHKT